MKAGDRIGLRARTGVFTVRMPSLWKTSSKWPLYLLSQFADEEAGAPSLRSRPRLGACWVTQAPVGLIVQPAGQTRWLACPMKNT